MSVDHKKNLIEVEKVSFSYGNNSVLKDITFNVHKGDYLGLIGPNGSGKTTLLKLMLGLLPPENGEVKLFGKSIYEFQEWHRLGYVPQKAVNFDPLFPATVREIVRMGRYGKKGVFRRINRSDEEIVDRVLDQVEMRDYENRLIGDLSGGQQQRVFIARALAGEPEIIFLDEPTVGVDVKTQEKFYSLLKKLNQELELTLVIVSHDIDVIVHEVTEMACINHTLIYHGEPKKFIKGDYLEKLYGKDVKLLLHDH